MQLRHTKPHAQLCSCWTSVFSGTSGTGLRLLLSEGARVVSYPGGRASSALVPAYTLRTRRISRVNIQGLLHQGIFMAPFLLARGSLPLSISAACSIVFLVLAPWSLVTLYGSPVKVRLSWQRPGKIVRIHHEASKTRMILIPCDR